MGISRKEMVNQLMVDCETLGTKSNSMILSIGAVMFDIETGETSEQFRVDVSPSNTYGLNIDASTVIWWLNQSKEAQNDLINHGNISVKLPDALDKFAAFIEIHAPDGIWGNGVRFDLGLLENAYNILGFKAPWPYWTERDVRTLVAFAPDIKNNMVNDLPHSPIHDCIYQIKYCSAIYQSIINNTKTQ